MSARFTTTAHCPPTVVTDDLLGKHFAVLGTSGCGKSCALALILRAVLTEHPNAHVMLLDPHNEYAHAFTDMAELINPMNLQLPYWLLNFEESAAVMTGGQGLESESEQAILKNVITWARKKFMHDQGDTRFMTVDTPVPYRLGDMTRQIDQEMGKLDKPENSIPYLRLMARIESLTSDARFSFMFGGGMMVRDVLPEILARLFRIPVNGKPITIFDLSGVPSEIVDVVVSVLCRMIFDFSLWSVRSKAVPITLVCEEAHRYIPHNDAYGFGPTKQAISRIAKEGRKYGVSLGLVSQRPSELSPSILSRVIARWLWYGAEPGPRSRATYLIGVVQVAGRVAGAVRRRCRTERAWIRFEFRGEVLSRPKEWR